MSALARRRRAAASLSASTVRAPSVVSARLSIVSAQAAFSRKYPSVALRRYQRAAAHTGGTTIRQGSNSTGLSSAIAPIVSMTDSAAVSVADSANLALWLSEETSRDA